MDVIKGLPNELRKKYDPKQCDAMMCHNNVARFVYRPPTKKEWMDSFFNSCCNAVEKKAESAMRKTPSIGNRQNIACEFAIIKGKGKGQQSAIDGVSDVPPGKNPFDVPTRTCF